MKTSKQIIYLTEIEDYKSFSDFYVAVRKKENRILNDHEILNLPKISSQNPNYSEWKIREKSAKRFTNYLISKKSKLNILEIGCGNGWFSNLMAATLRSSKVKAFDINIPELIQANRIFQRENLQFVFADIFKLDHNKYNPRFDIIVLNASVQYFPNIMNLIYKLKLFLANNGEIHIIDSPFYKRQDIKSAKQRTLDYYKKLGFEEMAKYYFHHNKDELKDFEILYTPNQNSLTKIIKGKDSPFVWIKTK